MKMVDAFLFFDYYGLANKMGEPNSLNVIGKIAYYIVFASMLFRTLKKFP